MTFPGTPCLMIFHQNDYYRILEDPIADVAVVRVTCRRCGRYSVVYRSKKWYASKTQESWIWKASKKALQPAKSSASKLYRLAIGVLGKLGDRG